VFGKDYTSNLHYGGPAIRLSMIAKIGATINILKPRIKNVYYFNASQV
jgi:hypothetical protein